MVFVTGLQGGVEHKSGGRWNTTASTYLSHSAVVIPYESARLCRTGKKEGDESDPPKVGGHVTRSRCAVHTHLSGPMLVALVLIYPCGKARNSPPEGR